MPTVPTQFVPQVDPTESRQGAYQAFPVQPMDNYAPRQLEAAGQRSLDLGNTVFRAGVLLEDARNDAMTRQLESMALGEANELINGEKGYSRTLLKDADDKFIPTVDALSGIAERTLDMTENDIQRAMLTPALARNFAAAKNKIVEHRSSQILKWNVSEHQARAGQYAQGAINEFKSMNQVDKWGLPAGKFTENLYVAHKDMHEAGVLMGFAEGSAQMNELHRAVDTQVAQGVVNRLMNENNYKDALGYIKKQNELGNLQEDSYERMLTSVTSNRNIQMADEIGTSIIETGMASSFSMFEQKPVIASADTLDILPVDGDPYAIIVKANPGSAITAPQTCTVSKVKRDKNGSYSVVLESDDGTSVMVENLRGPNLPKEGQVLQQDEQFAVVGNDNHPSTRVSASRNGKKIHPLNLNSFSDYDRETAEKPKTLQAALREAKEVVKEPEMLRRVQADIRQKFTEREMIVAKDREELLDTVTRELAKPGMTLAKLPKDLIARLDKKDLGYFMKGEQDFADLEYDIAVTNDPSLLLLKIEGKNENGVDISYMWLEGIRKEISPQQYLKFLKMSKEPETMMAATIDADAFNIHMSQAGLQSLVHPITDAQKYKSSLYRNEIKERVRLQQQRSGAKLEQPEINKIMDQVIMDKAMQDNTFTDTNEPIVTMDDEQVMGAYTNDSASGQMIKLISVSKKAAIVAALKSRNIEPTNAEIVKLFREMRRNGN